MATHALVMDWPAVDQVVWELEHRYGPFRLVAMLPADSESSSFNPDRYILVLAVAEPWLSPNESTRRLFLDAATALNERGGTANLFIDRIALVAQDDPFVEAVDQAYSERRLPLRFEPGELGGRNVTGGTLLKLSYPTPPAEAESISGRDTSDLTFDVEDIRSWALDDPYQDAHPSPAKKAAFVESFLADREKSRTTEALFRVMGRASERPQPRRETGVVVRRLLRKAPLVDGANWVPYRTWEIATAFERHLLLALARSLATSPPQISPVPASWEAFQTTLGEIRAALSATNLVILLTENADFNLSVGAREATPAAKFPLQPFVAGATETEVVVSLPSHEGESGEVWAYVFDPGTFAEVRRYRAPGEDGAPYVVELNELTKDAIDELAGRESLWVGRERWPLGYRQNLLRARLELYVAEFVELADIHSERAVALMHP